MCLAVPARIVECDHDAQTALVDLGGVRKRVSLMLVDAAAVDDYVLVHVGFALTVLSPAEAERTLALMTAAERAGVDGSAPNEGGPQ